MTKEKQKAPAFQFYPKDLLTDSTAMLMSNECLGIYIKLLCHDWINDGIPKDPTKFMKLGNYDHFNEVGSPRDGDEYSDIIKHISEMFVKHPEKPNYMTNKRLLKERLKQAEFSKTKSEAGKKGAISRWQSHDSANSSAIGLPMAKNGSSSSSSSSSSIKKTKAKKEREIETPQIIDPMFPTQTPPKAKEPDADIITAVSAWLENKPTDSASRAWCYQLSGSGLSGSDLLLAVKAQCEAYRLEGRELRYWPKLSKAIPDVDHARDLISGAVSDRLKKSKKKSSDLGAVNSSSTNLKDQEAQWKKELEEQGGPVSRDKIKELLNLANKKE